jgi:ribosomal protein S18 acetylase RimI-like enzyme
MNASTPSATLRWASPDDLPDAADFMARTISLDVRYISHGEIQGGLSRDGLAWVDDLPTRMREDFANPGPHRRVLLAFLDDALVGASVVLEHQDDRVHYMVTEDVAVAPEARSAGIGGKMMDVIEADARAKGCQWAFLESGLDNEAAHAFFQRRGYRPLSKVFAKPL